MTNPTCVVCPQLRRDRDPNQYERAQACAPCRVALADLVTEVGDTYRMLPASLYRDHAVGARTRGGNTEPPLPFVADVWDLLQPVRGGAVRDSAGDQIGHHSVATVLDSWIRDWVDTRALGEVGPEPHPTAQTQWLATRVDWACDSHTAVDEFAHEIHSLAGTLRRYAAAEEPRPQRVVGVACRRCDLKTLAKLADGTGDVECQNPACRAILRATEYDRWTRLLAAAGKGR